VRALLDISVLLAHLDADHSEHRVARAWFESQAAHGWASCAITQSGFVRAISQPAYPSPVPPAAAIRKLARATASPLHEFWPCDLATTDGGVLDAERIHGPGQVTDSYLLALAVSRGGRFVTFDRAVTLSSVRGAKAEHLVRI
jgi:toxin-antitoxin system PIN domain toxin